MVSPGLTVFELALIEDAVLLELAADEPDGKGGGVHRGLDLLEQEGQGTDVVLVPVGDEDAADLGRVFLQIGEIRDDQIDTGQVVIREGGAAIHNKDILLGLKDSQVLADLAQAAQGNDLERGAAGAVGLFAAAGAAVGLLRGSGRLFAAALGSGLLFGRLAFGGLVLRRGLGLLFGLILRGGLGLLLGLALRLALGGRSLLLLLGSGLLFLGGLGLAGLAALALLAVLGLGLRWLLLGSLGLAGLFGRGFYGPFSCGGGPCGGFLAAHHPFDLRRDLGGGFGAAALAEILPKDPVLLFTGCFGRSRYIILFFSHSCTSNSNLGSVFIFWLMYDVRPPIPFRRSCVLIHDKILHLAQIFWFCFYYTA